MRLFAVAGQAGCRQGGPETRNPRTPPPLPNGNAEILPETGNPRTTGHLEAVPPTPQKKQCPSPENPEF